MVICVGYTEGSTRQIQLSLKYFRETPYTPFRHIPYDINGDLYRRMIPDRGYSNRVGQLTAVSCIAHT